MQMQSSTQLDRINSLIQQNANTGAFLEVLRVEELLRIAMENSSEEDIERLTDLVERAKSYYRHCCSITGATPHI